jgi:hypothetical protein
MSPKTTPSAAVAILRMFFGERGSLCMRHSPGEKNEKWWHSVFRPTGIRRCAAVPSCRNRLVPPRTAFVEQLQVSQGSLPRMLTRERKLSRRKH